MFHCRQSATASSGFLAFGGIATFFSDHQTFFLGLLNIFLGPRTFFGCVWCRSVSTGDGGQSPTQWLQQRWGPFLVAWSILSNSGKTTPLTFFKWRMLFFHVSENTFDISPKNLSCDPKFALNIFSNCKTLCKFNWKGFQDKFANYSPRQGFCLQLKRSAKFSL